jgi:predicted DNA binding protein
MNSVKVYKSSLVVKSYCGLANIANELNTKFNVEFVSNNGKKTFFIFRLKNVYPNIKKVLEMQEDVIDYNIRAIGDQILISGSKWSHGVPISIYENGSFLLTPVTIRPREEEFRFATFSKVNIRKVIKAVKRRGNVVNSLTYSQCDYNNIMSEITKSFYSMNFTSNQLMVIKAAYEMGFFEWPRKITLNELSEALKLDETTVSYYLRNAQKKVFSNLEWS